MTFLWIEIGISEWCNGRQKSVDYYFLAPSFGSCLQSCLPDVHLNICWSLQWGRQKGIDTVYIINDWSLMSCLFTNWRKFALFFYIMPCSLIEIFEYFRATFCFHPKDRRCCENLNPPPKKKERKCCYQTEVVEKCLYVSGFEVMFSFIMNKTNMLERLLYCSSVEWNWLPATNLSLLQN